MQSKQIKTQQKSKETENNPPLPIGTDDEPAAANPRADFLFGVKLFLISGLVVLTLWLLNEFAS
jgi:hypothetical protein